MPLHPVVGRPAEVQAAGASLAAHQATRELPTAGPWAKFAASKKEEEGEEEEVKAPAAKAAATTPAAIADDAPSAPPSTSANDAASSAPAVLVQGLDFSYPDIDGRPLPGVPPVVVDMNLSLPAGSRCLLLGANGAGKTTLLKVLGGKHLVPRGAVSVSVRGGRGFSPFHDTALASSGALSYLGGNWERDVAFAGFSVPLAADFGAGEMLQRASAPGAEGAARREKLIEVLDIDPEWRMHRVSDGQRRRVQIAMGLLKPFDVLLLDEITVDLDVLGRADLMKFLTEECEERKATIVYATHIFDGLDSWPTHVAFLARGKLRRMHTFEELRSELEAGRLLELVEGWLRHEEAEADAERRKKSSGEGGDAAAAAAGSLRGGTGAGNDGGVASWSNGWAAGRMTSTLKNSSNAVMRM